MAEAVKVIVRCRPLNAREESLQCDVVVSMDPQITQVRLKKPKADPKVAPDKAFTFDGVYDMNETTEKIYNDICFPLVSGVLEGYNGTVFAYGQTGCGKSFTMVGIEDPPSQSGIIPRTFDHIFDHISVSQDTKYLVHASYLEIYNEEVRDLLGKDVKKRLDLKEHPEKGVYVAGLSSHKVQNRHDLERVMSMGSKNRSVGATLMNVDSSRSHSIFTIDIEMMRQEGGEDKLVSGRLNLVDLAGSERQSKTGSVGERLKEATKINLSLSALGNVISALVDGKSKHIPYRDSKLTRLLQSSLGGNTKTLMVSCISPADNNYDETLSTLRYANRAKNIKNKPKINEDPKDALLREYQEEIKALKLMLLGQLDVPQHYKVGDSSSTDVVVSANSSLRDYESEMEELRRDYELRITELQSQYGQEQSNRSKLEEEMQRLKSDYEIQLAAKAAETSNTVLAGGKAGSRKGSLKGEGLPSSDDQKILLEHEAAVQRLTNLQEGLIGGEKADDTALKQELESRKQYADDRLTQLRQANSYLDDDDNILEQIFNNLTEEVRVKTRAIERTQVKLKSAEDDIKDLQSEFEEERQDLLDTIRSQERQLQLHKQLIERMVPLIHRDCNYYNIDKIRTECRYDEDNGEWVCPKVIRTSTTLVPAVTSKTTPTHHSPSHQRKLSDEHRPVSPKQQHGGGSVTELSKILSKPDNTDYFKSKRAQELLAECSAIKGGASPERVPRSSKTHILGASNISPSHLPAGGAMFSVEPSQYVPVTDSKGKPRKLNSIPLPQGVVPAPPSADPSTIEQLDRMIAQKNSHRKVRQLDALHEPSHVNRKQF